MSAIAWNIDRILTQFTGLLRTNTIAAKRDLLAERTGLEKSVSVSLRKNGPKGGPEPSNFEDLCLVNVSVKYVSKLCCGTIKIQPELKYLNTILEDLTS